MEASRNRTTETTSYIGGLIITTMKPSKLAKIGAVGLGALIMLLAISGCSSTPETVTAPVSIGEQTEYKEISYTVVEFKNRGNTLTAKQSRYPSLDTAKKTEGRFIDVTFSVENKSNETEYVSAPRLIDAQGRKYDHSSFEYSNWLPKDSVFGAVKFQPSMKKNDLHAMYEVAADATGLGVLINPYSDKTFIQLEK